jgi:hypothetical protein
MPSFYGSCPCEEFEDTKGVIRVCKSKRTDNKMTKRKRMKGQPMMYKILQMSW